MRGFALINESSHEEITDGVLLSHAAALQAQLIELADWWERRPLNVSTASSAKAVPIDVGIVIVSYVDELLEKEALAYHSVDQHGRPRIYVGADIVLSNGGTLSGPNGLSCAASHEICETTVDPYCSFLVDMPESGVMTPIEVCDWVQGDSYAIGDTHVSNFVGPRAFSVGSAGPYDRMSLLMAPFTMRPGGYWSIRHGGPGEPWSSVFGAATDQGGMPHWQRAAKYAFGTRRSRRWSR